MNDRCRRYGSHGHSCSVGSRIRPRYVKDRSTNPPTLRKVGETDQYGLIQSFKDSCDFGLLVKRASEGDSTVLQRVQGLYFDSTDLPTEMTDMMNLGNFAANAWANLAPEIKEKFTDAEDFKNAILNGDFNRFSVTEVSNETDGKNADDGGSKE